MTEYRGIFSPTSPTLYILPNFAWPLPPITIFQKQCLKVVKLLRLHWLIWPIIGPRGTASFRSGPVMPLWTQRQRTSGSRRKVIIKLDKDHNIYLVNFTMIRYFCSHSPAIFLAWTLHISRRDPWSPPIHCMGHRVWRPQFPRRLGGPAFPQSVLRASAHLRQCYRAGVAGVSRSVLQVVGARVLQDTRGVSVQCHGC